jgi:hypothetical protein
MVDAEDKAGKQRINTMNDIYNTDTAPGINPWGRGRRLISVS